MRPAGRVFETPALNAKNKEEGDTFLLRRAFTACGCVFKEITLVVSNQGNYFENATACSKRTLKTTVATQL